MRWSAGELPHRILYFAFRSDQLTPSWDVFEPDGVELVLLVLVVEREAVVFHDLLPDDDEGDSLLADSFSSF